MIKSQGKDTLTNEKFNVATKELDTEMIARLLDCDSLSQSEVFKSLTDLCRRRCIKYCTHEYQTQHTHDEMFAILSTQMSSAVNDLTVSLSSDIEDSIIEKRFKNADFDDDFYEDFYEDVDDDLNDDDFERMNENIVLAMKAIRKCWSDFEQSLDYIDDAHGHEFTTALIQHVYNCTLA